MTFDPFADDVDLQAQPTNDVWNTEEKKDNKSMNEITNNANAKLTVTLKGGAGYDAPWIVIYADDAADALTQLRDPNIVELMDVVKKAGAHFSSGEAPKAASQKPQQAAQLRPGQPQGSTQPSNGESRYCTHGEMTYREGVSKAGKPYRAFFCPSRDRNDQCAPQWVR